MILALRVDRCGLIHEQDRNHLLYHLGNTPSSCGVWRVSPRRIAASGNGPGRLLQSAWNLIAFAVASIVVGLALNWTGDEIGYWVNLSIISVTDIGFILFVLVPGYVPIIPGIAGPVLGILRSGLHHSGILRQVKSGRTCITMGL